MKEKASRSGSDTPSTILNTHDSFHVDSSTTKTVINANDVAFEISPRYQIKFPVKISSSGYYVPERIITNHDHAKTYHIDPDWIESLTGIKERRYAAPSEQCSDLAVKAVRNMDNSYPGSLDDVDLIIFSSMSGDYSAPPTACIIQHKLELYGAKAFDIIGSCTSFVQSFQVASLYVNSGLAKKVLLVSADITSKGVSPYEMKTSILFGDAGACVVVERDFSGQFGIVAQDFGTDGSKWDVATILGGATHYPIVKDYDEDKHLWFKMKGKELFKLAIDKLNTSILNVLNNNHIDLNDIDHIIPHQANYRIITYLMEKLGIDRNKLHLTLDRFGNTATTSIPLTLSEAIASRQIKSGQMILLIGFGAGFNWGNILLKV